MGFAMGWVSSIYCEDKTLVTCLQPKEISIKYQCKKISIKYQCKVPSLVA